MRGKSFLKVAAVTLVLVTALLIALPALAITNGQQDGNNHPYVGLAVFDVPDGSGGHTPAWRCSASLLTPTLVLTAGHCTDGAVAARIWFDEVVQGNPEYPFSGKTSYDGTPITNPGFCIGCGGGLPGFAIRDVGLIVLSERVPKSVVGQYVQLPSAGLVDTLPNKTPIDFVGYGVQEQDMDYPGEPPRARWEGRTRCWPSTPTSLTSTVPASAIPPAWTSRKSWIGFTGSIRHHCLHSEAAHQGGFLIFAGHRPKRGAIRYRANAASEPFAICYPPPAARRHNSAASPPARS